MKKKSTPNELRQHSSGRTKKSLEQIEEAKRILRRQVQSGELLSEGVYSTVKLSDVLRLAKLNHNFLNGPSHKQSTKLELRAFVDELNEEIRAKTAGLRERSSNEQSWRTRYFELQEQHERVLTRIHGWQLRMRTLSNENRSLKQKLGIKIVPLQR